VLALDNAGRAMMSAGCVEAAIAYWEELVALPMPPSLRDVHELHVGHSLAEAYALTGRGAKAEAYWTPICEREYEKFPGIWWYTLQGCSHMFRSIDRLVPAERYLSPMVDAVAKQAGECPSGFSAVVDMALIYRDSGRVEDLLRLVEIERSVDFSACPPGRIVGDLHLTFPHVDLHLTFAVLLDRAARSGGPPALAERAAEIRALYGRSSPCRGDIGTWFAMGESWPDAFMAEPCDPNTSPP
jgi:hypothetical protein